MSLDGLRVNHAGLDTAATDLGTAVKKIDDRLNRLEQELAPLRSDWTGNAQQSYEVAKTKWDNAMMEMKSLLQETSNTVHQSNADYKAADQRGAASFRDVGALQHQRARRVWSGSRSHPAPAGSTWSCPAPYPSPSWCPSWPAASACSTPPPSTVATAS